MLRYGKLLVEVGVTTVGVEDTGGLTTALYQPSVRGVCWIAAEYQPSVSVEDGTTRPAV